MTRWTFAGFMALAALGAVAVLDVGSPTAEAAPSVSPFAGDWSGTWAIPERAVVGTFDWTISDTGRITGAVTNTTLGRSGTLAGNVGADGKLMFAGFVPDDAPGDGSNGFPFQGTAAIDGDGKLVVSVTGTDSDRLALVAILERD